MSGILVAPTETQLLKLTDWKSSSIPEKYGADIWWPHRDVGCVGVQRKTIQDLIASLNDGRVARELGQMKGCGIGVWMIEGEPKWTSDGTLIQSGRGRSISRQQWRGITLSLISHGFWTISTISVTDTIESILQLKRHLEKESPSSLVSRPKATGTWGAATSREWGIHWWQTFDGIGVTTAGHLYDAFGIPVRWLVTEQQLMSVKGVGKERARKMIGSLSQTQS